MQSKKFKKVIRMNFKKILTMKFKYLMIPVNLKVSAFKV